jgi:hypothetical protein
MATTESVVQLRVRRTWLVMPAFRLAMLSPRLSLMILRHVPIECSAHGRWRRIGSIGDGLGAKE